MKIRILCIGKVKERFTKEWLAEFEKRLSKYCPLNITEFRESNLLKEGEQLLASLKNEYVIAFDVSGAPISTLEFASLLKRQTLESGIAFIIGGPEGLSVPVLLRANQKISFSRMTFTHQIARLLAMEQIYRAFTIIKGEKYHK